MRRQPESSALVLLLLSLACASPTGLEHTGGPDLSSTGGAVTVVSTSPDASVRDTTLDVQVFGSGYDKGAKVDFFLNGTLATKLHVNRVAFVSSSQLTANVTIAADATPAFYDVQVTTTSGRKGIGTEAFAVELYLEIGSFGAAGEGNGINDAGLIVGRSDTVVSPSGRAYVWSPTTRDFHSLGLLEAYDIDQNNTVYGSASLAGTVWPARWVFDAGTASWGSPEFFATLIPQPQSTFILGINGFGQATGRADDAAVNIHIALWQSPATIVDLGECPGYTYGRGEDINASGQITGTCRRAAGSTTEFDGFLWTPATPNGTSGTFTMLPRFAKSVRNFPTAINDAGEVVGYSEDAKGNSTAVLWRPTGSGYIAVDLNAGTAVSARANDINNASIVVGQRTTTTRGHHSAFIWDSQGGARDLTTPGHIDASASAITQTLPWRIAGTGCPRGNCVAVRWLIP